MKENEACKTTVAEMMRENQRTSQMLKDANQLNAMTEAELVEVQQKRDELVREKKRKQREYNFYKTECTRFRKLQKERDNLAAR